MSEAGDEAARQGRWMACLAGVQGVQAVREPVLHPVQLELLHLSTQPAAC